MIRGLFDKNKTFRPNKKNHEKGTRRYELHKYAKATLGSGNLRAAVALPEGGDLNEWLAVNLVDFHSQIGLLYSSISEYCTKESCPVMCAGPKYEYHWADGSAAYKKPTKVSAPQYIGLLFDWISNQLDDESIFPSKVDAPFPKNFNQHCKQIFKRLFRVYAHIYYSHFQKVVSLGEEAHLNTCFKHFYYFITEFSLVEKKEMAPLEELINNLTNTAAKDK